MTMLPYLDHIIPPPLYPCTSWYAIFMELLHPYPISLIMFSLTLKYHTLLITPLYHY